jgi:hypothetical protein
MKNILADFRPLKHLLNLNSPKLSDVGFNPPSGKEQKKKHEKRIFGNIFKDSTQKTPPFAVK